MSSNVKISFYPNGRWDGGGVLPPQLKDFSNLAAWIKGFLEEIKDLRKNFVSAVQSDGRILGQEKANIVIEMDDVIGGLLLFRRYLTESHPDKLSATDGVTYTYYLELLDNTWNGNGKILYESEAGEQSFTDLHNDLILDKVKDLFTGYGKAVADRVLSPDERVSLCRQCDELFRDLLRIEHRLIHTAISG